MNIFNRHRQQEALERMNSELLNSEKRLTRISYLWPAPIRIRTGSRNTLVIISSMPWGMVAENMAV